MSFERPPRPEEAGKQRNLSPENQGAFQRKPERAKAIASLLYEGLYRIPGVSRIVGKLEIAYNQSWADRHEERAVGLKGEMDALDLRTGAIDQSRKEMESVIEDLRRQNLPGVEALQLKLGDIDRQREVLLNKKDRIQTRFESAENRRNLYINERDRIADRLIGRYNERIEPLEKKLERLQADRDQADLLVAVTEARHKGQLERLGDIEERKEQIEGALERTGMSKMEIRRFGAVRELEAVLEQGRERIRREREALAREKVEIDRKIAKVDAKANPYRDKREEFVRIKERRPLTKMGVETRKREREFEGEEEVRPRTREDRAEIPERGEIGREASAGVRTEIIGETRRRAQVDVYVAGWNLYIQEKFGSDASSELVSQRDFLEATGLPAEFKLDFEDFKNILGKYYKFRKIPMDRFSGSIDEFFEKKIKPEK